MPLPLNRLSANKRCQGSSLPFPSPQYPNLPNLLHAPNRITHRRSLTKLVYHKSKGRKRKRKNAPSRMRLSNRLRPTFPGSFPPSIIGSEGLNYCVRDGNRCDPNDIATRFFAEDMDCTFKTKQCFSKTIGQVFDLLVSVSSTCRHAYTSDLSTW